MNLNQKNPLCVCPVSGSNEGGCGVPMHLDLYTGMARNGLAFPAPAQSARRRRLLGDDEGVEILGLKDEDEKSLDGEFAKWVRDTVTKHVHIVGGNVIWEDVIPAEFGDYLRENCDTMEWSAKKFGLKVDFKGLTFHSEEPSLY